MEMTLVTILPLLLGYLLDLLFGDPEKLPHPIRLYGNIIVGGETLLNTGRYRFLKGMLLTLLLCTTTFIFFKLLDKVLLELHPVIYIIYGAVFIFYGLANKSLVMEGKKVFLVLQSKGIEAGRQQLSRIVGRDTAQLNAQQIRIAVFETMSENLSDGVIAPLFYYALFGVPGLMTYKMVNTLDSMIGYRNSKYEKFGKFAARLDDVANFIPARLTALLMVVVAWSKRGLLFIFGYGNKHKSPNAGYPEAALAGILNCRFGGPNIYHGKRVEKPFIGEIDREIKNKEIEKVSLINHGTCILMVLLIIAVLME